jgi:Uma2 family endonuclease
MAVGSPGATRESTWEDFVALDEDDPRELIDGVLVEVDVPTELHEHIVALLAFFLVGWARSHGGRVLASGYKVRISERRGVMPDLQYFGPENARRLPQAGLAQGHPDLAVEVVSETSRRYDRVTKLGWYAEIGTPEYWIVDPDARTLERLVLRDGRFVIAEALAEDAAFRPESFPRLEVPLAELWTFPGGEPSSPKDRGEA